MTDQLLLCLACIGSPSLFTPLHRVIFEVSRFIIQATWSKRWPSVGDVETYLRSCETPCWRPHIILHRRYCGYPCEAPQLSYWMATGCCLCEDVRLEYCVFERRSAPGIDVLRLHQSRRQSTYHPVHRPTTVQIISQVRPIYQLYWLAFFPSSSSDRRQSRQVDAILRKQPDKFQSSTCRVHLWSGMSNSPNS